MATTKVPTAKSKKQTKRRARAGVTPADWDRWVEHLANRRQPADLKRAIPSGKHSSLGWALPARTASSVDGMLKLVDRMQRGKASSAARLAEQVEAWLDQADQRTPNSDFAFECLAWSHSLVAIAEWLPADSWRRLLDRLLSVAGDASGLAVDASPLPHQLLSGELPLTLAYLFPEIEACGPLLGPARSALSLGVQELLDGEGLPHCRFLDWVRPLLASWTRCSLLARAMDVECFDEEARSQFSWIVHQALRLTRSNGTHVFTNGTREPWPPSLVRAANHLADDPDCAAIVDRWSLGGATTRAGSRRRRIRATPPPSVYSEWAETAIMRANWSPKSPQLTVTFGEHQVRTELNTGGRTLWSGPWESQVLIDGEPRLHDSEWSELCWFSDDEVDYLELEADLGHGWLLRRQLLLARTDEFVYLADLVLGPEPRLIEIRSTLPLGPNVQFEPASETREGLLTHDKRRAAVLPLALPEWRLDRADGTLEATCDGLVLTQRRHAQRLYAPRFIDLRAGRLKKELTWRQLTVAEQLEIVPRDVAVGYRVQVGQHQWLFYLSLAPRGNRTVLGQNYANEFVCGRFTRAGTVEALIEIE